MKALYYLLSSSQGFPISKCNSPSTKPEPNWQNIARLIAFVSNIFPKQEEIQFSDGQYTFFSKPQSLKNGSYYFVTIFTGDGPLINLSSLSSYIGFVTSVLFQVELDECFKHLGDQNNSAIQSSTYHDTIQNDSGGGDGDYENSLSCLHDIFPVLLERLSVFEEHFIRELLMSERDFYHRWFLSVSEYLHKALLCSQNCFSELYVVYQLSKDNLLSSLLTVHRNQNCHNEVFIDDLRSSLIEYAQSASMRGANLADPNPIDNIDQEQQVSHLLNVVTSHPSTTLLINDDGDVTSGSYFAVSQFVYKNCSLLMVCHIPNDMIDESLLHPILSTACNKPHDECWRAVNKSKIFPITALPVDLGNAWNTSLRHLQRAYFLSHTEADNLHDAHYYDDIMLSKEDVAVNAAGVQKAVQELEAVDEENCGDNLDNIEYFPQPPEKRSSPEVVNTPTSEVCRAEQVSSKKAVSRPGRKYA